MTNGVRSFLLHDDCLYRLIIRKIVQAYSYTLTGITALAAHDSPGRYLSTGNEVPSF